MTCTTSCSGASFGAVRFTPPHAHPVGEVFGFFLITLPTSRLLPKDLFQSLLFRRSPRLVVSRIESYPGQKLTPALCRTHLLGSDLFLLNVPASLANLQEGINSMSL